MRTVLTRVATALPALLLLIPLTAAESPGCESSQGEQGNSNSGVQGHANTQVDPAKARHAVVRVTEATGPYDVWTMAHEVGVALGDHYRDHRVSAGYVLIVTYTSGVHVEIQTRVSGHPNDMFRCTIEDGPAVEPVTSRGAGVAFCTLTTSQ